MKPEVDFNFVPFTYNPEAIKSIIKDGTKQLLDDTKKNMESMVKPYMGKWRSGKYYKKDSMGSIANSMKKHLYFSKNKGSVTYEGYQHAWQKKPVRNAEVAFIVEYGAPKRKGGPIPARAFMFKSCAELRADLIAEKYLDDLIK